MPRPTKLTPETHEKIVSAIRAGAYIETAAAFAGISKETLYKWLRNGARSKGGPRRRFCDAVHQALAASEVRDVTLIGKAAEEQWQAAAWRLERKHPDRWGRRERVEHVGKDGGPIAHQVDIDPDALSRRIAEVAAAVLGHSISDGASGDPAQADADGATRAPEESRDAQ